MILNSVQMYRDDLIVGVIKSPLCIGRINDSQ